MNLVIQGSCRCMTQCTEAKEEMGTTSLTSRITPPMDESQPSEPGLATSSLGKEYLVVWQIRGSVEKSEFLRLFYQCLHFYSWSDFAKSSY